MNLADDINIRLCFTVRNKHIPDAVIGKGLMRNSLFRPYIKLDLRNVNLYPHDTCTLCANEISRLANIYRVTHGLRHATPPLSSFLLTASTIHLLNLPSETSAAYLSQAIQDLQTISLTHYFAVRCLGIIQSLAVRWGIELPGGAVAVNPNVDDQFTDLQPSPFWQIGDSQASAFEGGSSSSNIGQQDFAFFPTTFIEQQPTLPDVLNNPAGVIDAGYPQDVLWTPFLTQAMPTTRQIPDPPMSHQADRGDEPSNRWTLADRSAPSSSAQFSNNPQQRGYKR